MATTIHLPAELLRRLDARAKALGVSRNRLIRTALEDQVGAGREWPPELVSMLQTPGSPAVRRAVGDMLAVIESSRSSRQEPTRR